MKKDVARDALVQEARELIVAMEAALLQIESDGPSRDAINAIFRAIHTIKGSAGLFAFESLVSFTHLLENVLDKVRNDILPLDGSMLPLLLNCGDYMDILVDAIAARKEEQDPNPQRRAELEAALNCYLTQAAAFAKTSTAPFEPATKLTLAAPEMRLKQELDQVVLNPYWHLSLRFSQNVLRAGRDPLTFLRQLFTMGHAVYLYVLDSALPVVEDMNPELCYLGFEIGLDSIADQAVIQNVFKDVLADSEFTVLPPHATLGAYRLWLARMSERDRKLLRPSQALSDAEWQLLAQAEAPATIVADASTVATMTVPMVQTKLPRVKPGDEKTIAVQKFIKIEVAKLDHLIDLVGELVIAGAGVSLASKHKKDRRLDEATELIAELVEQVRDAALNLRMVPIKDVFQRFPRVVRDMSRALGKNIELVVIGAETELDKSMVEKIADPLIHIVRNAIDHGIESAATRRAAGKPETGVLRLNATHESGSVVIEVFDDGRGLDQKKILKKAIQQGLLEVGAAPSQGELFRLIFEPGFSTVEKVTALSGRGVGMDVVKRNIDALHGEVDIDSNPGQGTIVRIRLPLTLAIIAGFQVVVSGAVFVIPLDLVVECATFSGHQVYNNVVALRGESLPFISLCELFDLRQQESPRKSLVVVQYGQLRAGLLVDSLVGQCQAVIKPLGKLFSKVKGLSGSTILGDGRVALILDVRHLISRTDKVEQVDVRRTEVHATFGE